MLLEDPLVTDAHHLHVRTLDGATLAGVSAELGIAGAWCIASYAGALLLFRWT